MPRPTDSCPWAFFCEELLTTEITENTKDCNSMLDRLCPGLFVTSVLSVVKRFFYSAFMRSLK